MYEEDWEFQLWLAGNYQLMQQLFGEPFKEDGSDNEEYRIRIELYYERLQGENHE